MATRSLPAELLATIVDRLALAVFVFRGSRLIYCNRAAEALNHRLRASYRIELEFLLRDHLGRLLDPDSSSPSAAESTPTVSLLTATHGEPFYVHVLQLTEDGSAVAVSVRAIGSEMEAIRRRYKLSAREAEVAALVLHGYRNTDIAEALGITSATTKKHLTRIFDKVGVHTRSQLQTRLA
jgi:DNA-binding CsgD family transcriptional regulator